MKKIIIGCFIWASFLSLPISSQAASVSYKIVYNSANENVVEIHEEVLKEAKDLFMSADMDSYEVLLMNGQDRFKKDGRRVSYANHQLLIVVGNGQGAIIEGDFDENGFCLPNVKPKSIIKEWLGL